MAVTPLYDPKTLIMLACLLVGVMGVVLLLMGRATRPRIPGVHHWAAGSLLTALAGVDLEERGPLLSRYVAAADTLFPGA